MFEIGDIIENKYLVTGPCSDAGGMGKVLFVTQLVAPPAFQLVLKYCKEQAEEHLKRFRREVRLLNMFQNNSKVVQIWDQNLDCDPPYFVMKFYTDGDLSTIAPALRASFGTQESVFLKMIDCIQELHAKNEYHRDIKPQNFLRDGDQLVVSDLGLSTEVSSATAFTSSSAYWGTHGYIPPEFMQGGFKYADAAGDIYMLGKTFYVLVTGRDPSFLMPEDVAPALFHVINRCCSLSKAARYQSLAELRQSLVSSYDVLLGRAGGVLQELFSAIQDRFATSNQYDVSEMTKFIEQLGLTGGEEQNQIIYALPDIFYSAITQQYLAPKVPAFLTIYDAFVERRSYSWSYAEVVARSMNLIFQCTILPPEVRAWAFDLAIRAAFHMHRFAAMNSCKAMLKGISDQQLALHVAPIILKPESSFLGDVEPSSCANEVIRSAIRTIHNRDNP